MASGSPKTAPEGPEEVPKKAEDGRKSTPTRTEEFPRRTRIAPRGLQGGPTTRPDGPKMLQQSPVGRARWSRRARAGPETPNGPQRGPPGHPERHSRGPPQRVTTAPRCTIAAMLPKKALGWFYRACPVEPSCIHRNAALARRRGSPHAAGYPAGYRCRRGRRRNRRNRRSTGGRE